jgi:ribulose-phosphate 3-epimerase
MSHAKCTISASILSADFARLGEEAAAVIAAGADEIHFDVMDNHYVPNLTVGPIVCEALRKYGIRAPIDVHLMTDPVDDLIVSFAKAGANSITFHPEASQHIDRSLQLIRSCNCRAGLAFNPATPLDHLDYLWNKLDMILIMSVNPGFGGQEFIPSALEKIAETKALIKKHQQKHKCGAITLSVDGGINMSNIKQIASVGADSFVMGSTIFSNKKTYSTIISELRQLLM